MLNCKCPLYISIKLYTYTAGSVSCFIYLFLWNCFQNFLVFHFRIFFFVLIMLMPDAWIWALKILIILSRPKLMWQKAQINPYGLYGHKFKKEKAKNEYKQLPLFTPFLKKNLKIFVQTKAWVCWYLISRRKVCVTLKVAHPCGDSDSYIICLHFPLGHPFFIQKGSPRHHQHFTVFPLFSDLAQTLLSPETNGKCLEKSSRFRLDNAGTRSAWSSGSSSASSTASAKMASSRISPLRSFLPPHLRIFLP